VGAPKSGTTALHMFLLQHPEIFMPLKKEIHHFADDIVAKTDYWLEPKHYFKLFKPATDSQIIGETSVFYLLSENAAKNIYKYNSDSKIIIMLRNPIEAAYSLHSQLVFNGEENVKSFEKAVQLESQRKLGLHIPKNTRIIKKHLYIETFKYADQVKRYLDIFPVENIKIILYDDFKNDTLKKIREIYEFLKVDVNYYPEIKFFNENKRIISKKLQKIYNFLIYKIFSKFLSENSIEKIRQISISINSYKVKRKPLQKNTKDLLKTEFRPDIINLEKILKTNLNYWYE
jgi:hypothetical protein